MTSKSKGQVVEIDSEFVVAGQVQGQTVAEPQGAASLDQVRELLIGSHTRDLEQRLVQVEKGLEQAVSSLTADMTGRLDQVDDLIKNELKGLLEKLGTQREERSMLFQELKTEIEETSRSFEGRLNELSARLDATNETHGELRQQIDTVSREMETGVLGIKQDLTAESDRIRAEMVDRAAMSSVFGELALKLSVDEDPHHQVEDTLDEVLG